MLGEVLLALEPMLSSRQITLSLSQEELLFLQIETSFCKGASQSHFGILLVGAPGQFVGEYGKISVGAIQTKSYVGNHGRDNQCANGGKGLSGNNRLASADL